MRDSAGIHIVENTAAALSDRFWTVADDPVVTIGLVEGDPAYLLDGVTGATRLSDGTIVIANAGTKELRAFDATGAHEWTAGGEGEGPGELVRLDRMIRIAGDTLLVTDPRLRRVSAFSPSGDYVRNWKMVSNEHLLPSAVLADGTLVGTLEVPSPGLDGMTPIATRLIRFDERNTRPVEVGPITSTVFYMAGGGAMSYPVPFQPHSQVAVHAHGVYAGNGERYEIFDYESDGTLRRILRVSGAETEVTPRLHAAEVDAMVAAVPESFRKPMRAALEQVPQLPSLPAFSALIVDSEGSLWARQYRPLSQDAVSDVWHVFGSDGHLLGAVDVPRDPTIYEIGADYILGLTRDELDVERIEVYRLLRGTT